MQCIFPQSLIYGTILKKRNGIKSQKLFKQVRDQQCKETS